MEQDESVDSTLESGVAGQPEVATATVDGGEIAEPSTEGLSFGSVANPKRLRLGVSPAL